MANAISDHISRTLLRTDYSGLEPSARDLIDRIVELAPHPMPEPSKESWLDRLADRIAERLGDGLNWVVDKVFRK